MTKKAKTDSPEDTGKNGVEGISRRGLLRTAAVGAGAAATGAGKLL